MLNYFQNSFKALRTKWKYMESVWQFVFSCASARPKHSSLDLCHSCGLPKWHAMCWRFCCSRSDRWYKHSTTRRLNGGENAHVSGSPGICDVNWCTKWYLHLRKRQLLMEASDLSLALSEKIAGLLAPLPPMPTGSKTASISYAEPKSIGGLNTNTNFTSSPRCTCRLKAR